jgi:hypothetical protein
MRIDVLIALGEKIITQKYMVPAPNRIAGMFLSPAAHIGTDIIGYEGGKVTKLTSKAKQAAYDLKRASMTPLQRRLEYKYGIGGPKALLKRYGKNKGAAAIRDNAMHADKRSIERKHKGLFGGYGLSEYIALGEKKIKETKKKPLTRKEVRRMRQDASFGSMVGERAIGTAIGTLAAAPGIVLIGNALKKA